MSKKILVSFILISILCQLFLMYFPCVVEATDAYFAPYSGSSNKAEAGVDYSQKVINRIIGVIKIVGVFLATAMLVFIGIKWMLASPDGKAEVKKNLSIYVIGAVVMYGSAGILQIVQKFVIEATESSI